MKPPTYSFNPYDWSTITPLLDSLVDASVTDHTFSDWLAKWNQLDIDLWDAYTQLKHPAYVDTRNQHAEAAFQAYVKNLYSTYISYTAKLTAKALRLQPDPPSEDHQQLWRRWHNQASLSTHDNLPILSEISQLENRYRTIMWQSTGAADWLERRDDLSSLLLRLLKLRRMLAQNSGLPTYLDYRWRELNRLDYSVADCQVFHHAVEKMVPEISAFRKQARPWDQAFPQVDNVERLTEGAEHILMQVDPAFGEIFHTMRNGYLDLGQRPNKASSNESWFFSGAGMPYIHVASGNVGSIFHESGHALHDYLSFQSHGSLWNFNGPEVFQEFAATSMDMLCWPYYAEAQGGIFRTSESIAARQNVLQLYLEFCFVRCTMEDAFEHWLYGEAPEGVKAADLDAKWLELKERFEPWDDEYASLDEKMTGWQRNTFSLYRYPLYMITYAMATVGTCQLARLAEEERARTVLNYKTALTLGNTRTLPELFNVTGITFPFNEQAVSEAIHFVFDEYHR